MDSLTDHTGTGTAPGTDSAAGTDTAAGVAGEILGLLRLEALEVDMFRGQGLPGETRRLYGGQVAAQALAAAGHTVEGARPHSLHAYFLRPGDSSAPVVFGVERLHDGRTFRRRRVTAIQQGRAILCLESSFTTDTSTADDYIPAPNVPAPHDCPEYDATGHVTREGRISPWLLFETRSVPFGRDGGLPEGIRPTSGDMWFRLRADGAGDGEGAAAGDGGDGATDGIMPETIITYLSDLTLAATALRPTPGHPDGRTDVTGLTSLDHSMWFHNPPNLSDWLLFAKMAPVTAPIRSLTAGQIFSRDGILLASVAQECLTHAHSAGQS